MLNQHDKNIHERLDVMSIDEARQAIAQKEFGDMNSPAHRTASAYLALREARERDKQDATLRDKVEHIHDRLLELKKPHWSLTPSFIIAVLAMLFAAIAAWSQITKWIQPAATSYVPSKSQSQQSHSEAKK